MGGDMFFANRLTFQNSRGYNPITSKEVTGLAFGLESAARAATDELAAFCIVAPSFGGPVEESKDSPASAPRVHWYANSAGLPPTHGVVGGSCLPTEPTEANMAKSSPSTRCQPGDIAIIIHGGNCGALVTIDHAYDGNPLNGVLWNGGPSMWVIRTLGSAKLGAYLSDQNIKETHFTHCAMPDAWLCPMRKTRRMDQTLRQRTTKANQGVKA